MSRLILLTGILATMVLVDLAANAEAPPRFAMYRVELVENESAPPLARKLDDPRLVNLFVTQEYFLATAVKLGDPVLTESDIEKYCWSTQRLHLTAEGADRWDSLGGFQVPLTGLPLLVEVDGEPRYGAMVWNPASSFATKLPQFWCKSLDNRIILRGLRHSAARDTIYPGNYDPKVRQLMGELGKLSDNCEGE